MAMNMICYISLPNGLFDMCEVCVIVVDENGNGHVALTVVFLTLSILYPNDRLSGFAMATKTCRAAKLYQRPFKFNEKAYLC